MRSFDLTQMAIRDRYQLLTRSVAPRPIALVSSLSVEGIPNLAPFSFFNVGGANPPSCIISPVNTRDSIEKDTLLNIRDTGEYVINVVVQEMGAQVSQCSFAYPPEVNEFNETGFTPLPSVTVKPARVQESPIHLECKLAQIATHGEGPLCAHYIIGEVVQMHVDESVMTDDKPDNRKLAHLGRLGEDLYVAVSADRLFSIPRPV